MAAKSNSKRDSLLIALRKGDAEKVRRMIVNSGGGGGGGETLHADMAADSAMNALLHRAARYGHGKVVQVGTTFWPRMRTTSVIYGTAAAAP